MLAFASSAGSVAWNKFSQIWFLSVGLSPTETGFLKSVGEQPSGSLWNESDVTIVRAGQLAKTAAQPMWAAIADMELPGN